MGQEVHAQTNKRNEGSELAEISGNWVAFHPICFKIRGSLVKGSFARLYIKGIHTTKVLRTAPR